MSHERQPNILIVYPDQMRADAMSCAGNPCIKTPHMDRLANEGVRFENAFVAFPLCSPFRAALFTGKYPHANGQCANHYPIPLGQPFLAEVLRDAGYRTGYIGKWHLEGGIKPGFVPPDRRLGFDHFVGFNRGHYYFDAIYYRGDSDQPLHSPRYEPDFQTDHLIAFMQQCVDADDDRPFFAMVCFGPPHGPVIAPPHFQRLYSPDEVPIRANTPADGEGRAREFLARYYGLVANVDHDLGRVLGWLDRAGIADDTLVILVSDHGDMAGEHGRYGKKVAYDASMRVPFLVRYPRRVDGGRVVSSLVDPSVDVMPTLLEICGIDVPDDLQGTSCLSLLRGSDEPTRDAVYYELCKENGDQRILVPERGVRTLDWLYVRTEAEPKMLHDLRIDPLEMHDLVAEGGQGDVMDKLDGMLREHMKRTGDDWGLEAKFPPPDFMTHEEGAENAKRVLAEARLDA